MGFYLHLKRASELDSNAFQMELNVTVLSLSRILVVNTAISTLHENLPPPLEAKTTLSM